MPVSLAEKRNVVLTALTFLLVAGAMIATLAARRRPKPSLASKGTALPNEPLIRLASFAGIFAAMALWEFLAPRRPQAVGRWKRWPGNIGIVVIDTLAVRVLFPTAAVGVALGRRGAAAGACST